MFGKRQRWWGYGLLGLVGLVVLSLWLAAALPLESGVRVVFCDVGQGDGAIVVAPGGEVMLVDTGPMGGGMLECLQTSLPFYQRKIEVVVISHPQDDHVGELLRILDRYRVGRVVMIESQHQTAVIKAVREKIAEKGTELINPRAGDVIWLGLGVNGRRGLVERGGIVGGGGEREKKVRFYITWPPVRCARQLTRVECAERDINELSVAGKLEYGRLGVWFLGDLSAVAQARMRQRLEKLVVVSDNSFSSKSLADKLTAEIIKVPHHGSGQTGIDWRLVEETNAELAVVSVEEGNRFGHPAAVVMAEFVKRGLRVRRTDEVGAVVVGSDGDEWWVE